MEQLKISVKTYGYGVLIGLFIGLFWLKDINQFIKLGGNLYGDLLPLTTASYPTIFLAIFQRNFLASLLTIGLGVAHRYLTMFILILNGIILGVILYAVLFFNLDIFKFIFLTLPHGVFEIPAFLLSGSLGIRLSQKGKKFNDRFLVLKNSWPLLLEITVLLLIAALIESSLIVFNRP